MPMFGTEHTLIKKRRACEVKFSKDRGRICHKRTCPIDAIQISEKEPRSAPGSTSCIGNALRIEGNDFQR